MWTVRTATPSDHEGILAVVEEAFTGPGRDGQEEIGIVSATWRLGAAIPGLELVAVEEGAVIGHVLGARGDLSGRTVVAVAPLSVASRRRCRGVGSALMTELIRRAEEQHWPAVVLLGNPAYYGRFGFGPAGPFGVFYEPVGKSSPHFQIRRLSSFDGSLRGALRYCWETAE